MDKKYGSKRFYELLEIIGTLHSKKSRDYAGDSDPLSNLEGSIRLGIPAWKGVLVRIGDKFDRINNLAKKDSVGEVKEESILDTLQDLAVYSLLCIVLYEKSNKISKTH